MKRPVFEPARDLDWLDRNAPAARANALCMFATLEHIAINSNDAAARDIAHNALNKVFAWRPTAVKPVAVGELENEIICDLIGREVWSSKEN